MPELRVISKLRATTAITDLVGTRIRPGVLDELDAYPAIYVSLASEEPENYSEGELATGSSVVEVDVLALTYLEARTIRRLVWTALAGHKDATGAPHITMCHRTNTDYNVFENDVRDDAVLIHDFTITYRVEYEEP